MTFSAYSVPLRLAYEAKLWDGDVVAEDHHAYIKALLYSTFRAGMQAVEESNDTPVPALSMRAVMLPSKSTSVNSDKGYWATWGERWEQQKRHSQGVAEFSYMLLCIWDLLATMPLKAYTSRHMLEMLSLVRRAFLTHVLPPCQCLALGALTLYWLLHGEQIPMCPDRLILFDHRPPGTLLCGLAGAWVLVWPVVVPSVLMAVANILFIYVSFIQPGRKNGSIWASSSGQVPSCCPSCFNSQLITTLLSVIFDMVVLFAPIMGLYGIPSLLIAYWNVMVRGNRFKYVTATKAASGYGSLETQTPDKIVSVPKGMTNDYPPRSMN